MLIRVLFSHAPGDQHRSRQAQNEETELKGLDNGLGEPDQRPTRIAEDRPTELRTCILGDRHDRVEAREKVVAIMREPHAKAEGYERIGIAYRRRQPASTEARP